MKTCGFDVKPAEGREIFGGATGMKDMILERFWVSREKSDEV